MDSEHLEFRPSPYLKKLLGFAPHQVFDEHGQTSYTLKDGAIRVELRRPLITPVAYIKLQDQNEREEDNNGDEGAPQLDSYCPVLKCVARLSVFIEHLVRGEAQQFLQVEGGPELQVLRVHPLSSTLT